LRVRPLRVDSPRGAQVALVALASAVAGAAMGALDPSYQVAIEPAQVLAGVVSYPPGNPFAAYQMQAWTIWHQILAPLLAMGVGERALTIATSAAVGAISFTALAVMALAYGARPALSFAAPFVLLRLVTDPDAWGFHYPILLIRQGHTYGTVGFSWLVLVCGLFAAGCTRTAAFLLGLAPALHPTLGAIFALLTGICALFGPASLRRPGVVAAGAAGLAISGASLAAQRLLVPVASDPDPLAATRYLEAFVRLWDYHRQPIDYAAWNVVMVGGALLFSVVLLRRLAARLPAGNVFSTRIFLACGLFGIASDAALRCGLLDATSPAVAMGMPTRLLNFVTLAWVPIVIGFSDRFRAYAAGQASLIAIAVLAVVAPLFPWLQGYAYGAFCVLPLVLAGQLARGRAPDGAAPARIGAALAVAFGMAGLAAILPAVASAPARFATLRDRSNDAALAAASRTEGLLVLGPGLNRIQLRTRRPVLLDPESLDMLPYAADGGVEMGRILSEVYGIDFFDPPGNALHLAVVPTQPVRHDWQLRSTASWTEIGARFGASHVLVKPKWVLQLPEVARSDLYALYRIPDRVEPSAR
jgi:hypothetical protein